MWQPLDLSDKEIAAARRIFVHKARFQADESVARETVDLLRARGFNVRTADEAGLRGRDDEDHLAEALREDRILLTEDADFLDDRRFPTHRNPGVVVLPEMRSTDESLDGHLRRNSPAEEWVD